MKFRLPGRSRAAAAPDPAVDLTEQQLVAAGKGRPTPKRAEAQGRRQGPVPPPPTTRKEAYRRMRDQQAAQRASGRGAVRGVDADLPARDRGPAKKLVRDIVDSRRNVGSVFLLLALFLIVSLVVPSEAFKSYSSLVALLFFVALAVDSVLLRRRIRTLVAERLPNATDKPGSLVWYGISRSTMIRRWRFPKAQVGLGDEI
ncbi:DUF3043 domain-containing protein [Goekera deserti]|uniref:DUF3043 domain-containing protein n=1 Tax=Goekera deserti TaxID=2497753 RepID=UPI001F414960|nr:DUF3043 domain-containing protein [Goekera deserti]